MSTKATVGDNVPLGPLAPLSPARGRRFTRADEQERLERLFEAMDQHHPQAIEVAIEMIRSEIPFYRDYPVDELREILTTHYRLAVAARKEWRGPTAEELQELAALAEMQARRGVPLDVMFQRSRLSVSQELGRFDEMATRFGVDAASRLEFVRAFWGWHDTIMACAANAHRAVELERARHDQEHRAAFVRTLLFGSLPSDELRMRGPAFGLALGDAYIPFRARTDDEDSASRLLAAIEKASSGNGHPAVAAVLNGDVAGVVSRRPPPQREATIALGPPTSLDSLEPAFRVASRALDTAVAFGVKGVVSFDDLSLRPAVLGESHLGDRLVERYIKPLLELGNFGETLEHTVREYLALGMRVEDTARALFVHPNTLRHRLERFEELTGADLRNTQDLVEVWWALERRLIT